MTTVSMTIDLPRELAERVRAKVASGEYASESDVVRDGLESFWEDEAALPSGPAWEAWVRDELRPAIAAHEADPTRGIPIDVVRARLAARHSRRLAAE